MTAETAMTVVGRGLYPLPEAARLAQLDTRTARRWAEGYRFTARGESRVSASVIPVLLPRVGAQPDLTFAEMLTLRLVRGFRRAGLGLPTIKRVAERASQQFDLALPFVSKRFRTDGRTVFLELQERRPDSDGEDIPPRERHLIEVLTGQLAFAEVVEPSLFANVDWHEDMASRWWPLGRDHAVILDPGVLFGAPRLAETSVPTATLAAAVLAEGGGDAAVAAVSEWYGVSGSGVRDALHFETEWLRQAA